MKRLATTTATTVLRTSWAKTMLPHYAPRRPLTSLRGVAGAHVAPAALGRRSKQTLTGTTSSNTSTSKPKQSTAPGGGKPAPAPAAPAVGGAMVVELTEKTFAQVVQRSPVPVILDCYADWCEPCKVLTPQLEGIVSQPPYKGKVMLAKLNVDRHQAIAMDLDIKSLPTIFGIYQGKLVAMLTGVPSTKQLKDFFDKLTRSNAQKEEEGDQGEAALAQADKLLQEGKFEDAGKAYKTLYEALSKEKEGQQHQLQALLCLGGLARCAVETNRLSEAEQLYGMITAQLKNKTTPPPALQPTLAYIQAALAAPRTKEGESAEEALGSLRMAIEKEPQELEHRYQLSLKLLSLHRHEEALTHCLDIIKRERGWKEGAAKKLAVTILESCPNPDLAKKGRARLTNLLFL